MIDKPYAESCDQNREPILTVIRPLFKDCKAILEIGSGTGQHAVYFAHEIPHLIWYTSDREQNHPGIRLWLADAALPNVQPPLTLDVGQASWPAVQVDAIFSANTVHIMHWHEVQSLFSGVAQLLPPDGLFVLYGPFNHADAAYTSESNARFDAWLRARDPESGLRDSDALDWLANSAGMVLIADYAMPVNNRILVWRKQE